MEISVGRSHVALIDVTDYDIVGRYRWHAHRDGRNIYARRRELCDGRMRYQFMHDLILGVAGVDHIDHDGLNNQRANLRLADHAQNQYNRRAALGSTSTYKGVSWRRDKRKWQAQIMVARRTQHLGYFGDEAQAAHVYDTAAREFFGEYAGVNFP